MRWLLVVLLAAAPIAAEAQGLGGRVSDRLDAPGSPTDRYLDSTEVRTTLHEANESFFMCFRRASGSRAGVGDASVEFIIERTGATSHGKADLGTELPGLKDCLEEAVGALVFDDHDGDPIEVAYPTVYVVDRKGARVLDYPVVFTRPRPVRLPLLLLPPNITHGEVLLLERILTHDEPPPDVGDEVKPDEAEPAADMAPEEGDGSAAPSPEADAPD
jgi:hypothetical protein